MALLAHAMELPMNHHVSMQKFLHNRNIPHGVNTQLLLTDRMTTFPSD